MEEKKYLAKTNLSIEEHSEMLIHVLESLRQYGYINDEHLFKLVKMACIHHDDGKANPEFQDRIRTNKKFNSEKEVPHNILSGCLIDKDEFHDEDDYYNVLFAILYHHNYGNPYELLDEKKDLIKDLLKEFEYKMISHKVKNEVQRRMDNKEAIRIKGFLHKCDYSASGSYTAEIPNDFLEMSMENVKLKWKKYDLKSDWNELQKFAKEKCNENVIMIAQTGMGKTEAGLRWIGNNKGYFVLPLRTAINAIYNRIKDEILLNEKVNYRLSILHSESLAYYADNLQNREMDITDYEKRGKNLAMPLSISTMDQLFDFVFKYPCYELKLITLSYSKIVIDEIQMYDPQLLAYLIYGLKQITEFGGKVAIMTATLSPFIQELLTEEIPFRRENIQVFTNELIRHNLKTFEADINSNDILNLYYTNKEKRVSNKILVVCNTIKKTQELYIQVKDEIDDVQNIHILHSRYTRKDRAEREKEIQSFGKTYDEDGEIDVNSGIWFSTSLVEASLDIDFDFLVTELQDLNSLFQRLGRCNRKGVKPTSEANCYVYLSSSNRYIDETIFNISKMALKTVNGILLEKDKVNLLNQYMTMENLKDSEYYLGKDGSHPGYKGTMEWLKKIKPYEYEKDEKRLRNIFSMEIIPSPVYLKYYDEIKEAEELLKRVEQSSVEKIKIKEHIMQYSVNIPYYQWNIYQKEVKKGMAQSYSPIVMGKYEELNVMECQYDELGFQQLDYENTIREANIF